MFDDLWTGAVLVYAALGVATAVVADHALRALGRGYAWLAGRASGVGRLVDAVRFRRGRRPYYVLVVAAHASVLAVSMLDLHLEATVPTAPGAADEAAVLRVENREVVRLRAGTVSKPGRASRTCREAFVTIIRLPGVLSVSPGSLGRARVSRLTLREGDVPLGPANAPLLDVCEKRGGRYLHRSGGGGGAESHLFFSASDDSNVKRNGRRYTFRVPVGPNPWLIVLLFAASVPAYLASWTWTRAAAHRLLESVRGPGTPAARWAGGALVAALFLMPLAVAWSSGRTEYLSIGGLLPWSDARGWFTGLLHLMYFDEYQPWSVRRPLNPAFLAGLWLVSGKTLQGLLMVRAVLLGLAAYVLAIELKRWFGATAAMLALGLLALFASNFSPLTMCETTGLLFAAAGTALLLRGVREEGLLPYLFGALLFALGMSARPGALLVLGAPVLWPLLRRGWGWRRRGRWMSGAVGGVALASLINMFWVSGYHDGRNVPGSNAALVLYGLAKGGETWHAWSQDFPELARGDEAEQARLAARESLRLIAAQPGRLLAGLRKFWGNYWDLAWIYVPGRLRTPLLLLMGTGLATCVLRIRQPRFSFLLLAAGGVLLSVPLLFWSGDAYRTLIVTAPLDAALAALGLHSLTSWSRRWLGGEARRPPRPGSSDEASPRGQWVLAAVLLSVPTWLALASVALIEPPAPPASAVCPAGQQGAVIAIGPSPYLRIRDDRDIEHTWLPDVRLSDFRRDPSFARIEIADALEELGPGDVVMGGFGLHSTEVEGDWIRRRGFTVLIDRTLAQDLPQHALVCGNAEYLAVGRYRYLLLRARSIEALATP